VQRAALVETYSQQLRQRQPIKNPYPKKKPPINRPSKNTVSSFSESFISSGKQGGGATVLREGRDILTRETHIPISLNINNLRKAAGLNFASAAGVVPNSAC
jgi:hypothetical protein